MRIGLLSDTHIRIPGHRNSLGQLCASELPHQVKEAFRGVDLILHAGDIYTLPVLDDLETVAPILAAEGDDDPFEVANDTRVKERHTITAGGLVIWLAHYELWPEEGDSPPDVIVYGHTHQSALVRENRTLRINPGSPTFPNYRHTLGTVAFLEINSGTVEARIVPLEGTISGASSATLRR